MKVEVRDIQHVFHRTIKPRYRKNVDYCVDTGAAQSKLDYSSFLKDVLEEFDEWLIQKNIKDSRWIFVTLENWDLKNTLFEYSNYKIDVKPYFQKWVSIRHIFPGRAENLLDIMYQMRLENAYKGLNAHEDAYNLLEITKGMIRAGIGVFPEDISISK